jgi:kynurenine formamidase
LGKPRIVPRTLILKGDRSNTSFIENLTTHTGTHIDVLYHMVVDGATLDQFDISEFIFYNPLLLEIIKDDLEKISVEDLSRYEGQIRSCDVFMLYTGFSRYRSSDPNRYLNMQPGLSEEGAQYLTGFPNLRCIAIDLVGIENVPEGRRKLYPVHKILFNAFKKLIILEDAALGLLVKKNVKKVYVIPLFIKHADGAPATAFAEIE